MSDGSDGDSGKSARDGMGFGGTGSGIGGDRSFSGEGSSGQRFDGSEARANPKPGESAEAQSQAASAGLSLYSAAQKSRDTGESFASIVGMEPGMYLSDKQLRSLSEAGYGDMLGTNPNNMDGQTVDHQIAANNVASFMNAVMPAVLSASPLGSVMTFARVAEKLNQGMTIGDAVKDLASGFLGNRLGIGGDAVRSAVDGNFADAAGLAVANKLSGMALGGLTTAISKETGLDRTSTALGLSLSGASGSLIGAAKDASRSITGGVSRGSSDSDGQGDSSPTQDGTPAVNSSTPSTRKSSVAGGQTHPVSSGSAHLDELQRRSEEISAAIGGGM